MRHRHRNLDIVLALEVSPREARPGDPHNLEAMVAQPDGAPDGPGILSEHAAPETVADDANRAGAFRTIVILIEKPPQIGPCRGKRKIGAAHIQRIDGPLTSALSYSIRLRPRRY